MLKISILIDTQIIFLEYVMNGKRNPVSLRSLYKIKVEAMKESTIQYHNLLYKLTLRTILPTDLGVI